MVLKWLVVLYVMEMRGNTRTTHGIPGAAHELEIRIERPTRGAIEKRERPSMREKIT